MAGLTLDSGALIALEKNKREVWALLKLAVQREAAVSVPATVLAQAWRKNAARIATVLKGCAVVDLDERQAKKVGVLLGKSKQRDVVDAHVVIVAAERNSAIVTSDPDDLEPLARHCSPAPALASI